MFLQALAGGELAVHDGSPNVLDGRLGSVAVAGLAPSSAPARGPHDAGQHTTVVSPYTRAAQYGGQRSILADLACKNRVWYALPSGRVPDPCPAHGKADGRAPSD